MKSTFKKFKRSVLILFLLSTALIFSQKKSIEITYKKNSDKSVNFYYKKTDPGSRLIILNFNRLENSTNKRIVKKTVKGTSGNLFTLRPINKKKGIGFSYKFSHKRGDFKAKVNIGFKYVLPFKNNKEVEVHYLNYLGKRFGNSEPKNWRSLQFLTKPNDTVCASRKGIVVKIIDKFIEGSKGEYSFKNKSNYIIIEHSDGTLAKYGVLKKNSILVKLGDKVYPSTPIALSGTYYKPENSQLRFSVYYLDKEAVDSKKVIKQSLANQKHYYAYVNPLFYVTDNVTRLQTGEKYITVTNEEIIQFEMSKREKKKRK